MSTVAVAVNSGGNGRGNGSKRAVKWAVDNLFLQADRFVLVHVIPVITHIPTPSGDRTPIKDLDANNVAKYTEDVRETAQEIFLQYKKLFKSTEFDVETKLLEHDNVADALVEYISQSGIRSLVMGSESKTNHFWRKIKGAGVPQTLLQCAAKNCDIFVVSKLRVKSKLASSLFSGVAILMDKEMPFMPIDRKPSMVSTTVQTPLHSSSSSEISTGPSSWSEDSLSHFLPDPCHVSNLNDNLSLRAINRSTSMASINTQLCHVSNLNDNLSLRAVNRSTSMTSINTQLVSSGPLSAAETLVSYEQFDLMNDLEQLQLELHAIQDLINAQEKVQIVSSECVKEAENTNATGKEESLRSVVEQQKLKHLQALKDEVVKNLLAKETRHTQNAELNALKETEERQKTVDALISSEGGPRRYTLAEIKAATAFFSEKKVIGVGGYGKVYKGNLDHIPVAIKVLHPGATDKKKEFLREVKILSQLRHPNIMLLVGACSEIGCLVYEYMENGSLEDHIFRNNGRAPLPWFARFRIAYEIACGIAFLHRKKPEPIVHRDLKPGNILLGRDYVSKISDVGMAKLLSNHVPESITMIKNTLLAGTLYYIDPEYQRTGTVRPKSDLYSFGIIILQLLTARHPNGLLLIMENAIASGSLSFILDDSVKDWPLAEAEELTRLALQCCELRCRDRPDLETRVLPVLKKLADASMEIETKEQFGTKSLLLSDSSCDGNIAVDDFTYEHRTLEVWL